MARQETLVTPQEAKSEDDDGPASRPPFDLAALPEEVRDYVLLLQSENDDRDNTIATLRKRNSELAVILGHSQSETTRHEAKIKELTQALSQARHELASHRQAGAADPASGGPAAAVRTGGADDDEDNPYLSAPSSRRRDGSIVYVAASAQDILAGNVTDSFDDQTLGDTAGVGAGVEGLSSAGPSPSLSSSSSSSSSPSSDAAMVTAKDEAVREEHAADGQGADDDGRKAEEVEDEENVAVVEEERVEQEVAEESEEEQTEEYDEAEAAKQANVKALLSAIFKSLLSLTGTSERVLGKAEFDLLGSVCGLEDSKKLREDLTSAAAETRAARGGGKGGRGRGKSAGGRGGGALVDRKGLSCAEFVAAFTSQALPVPGSSVLPSAVWKHVEADTMGPLLKDDKRRALLETELGRWHKALDVYGESSDGEYEDEDDEDDEDEEDADSDPEGGERVNGIATDDEYEPWELGPEGVSGGVEEMRARFEVLGKKRHGERNLGDGVSGVVRKCRERVAKEEAPDSSGSGSGGEGGGDGGEAAAAAAAAAAAVEGGSFADSGSGRVLACKIISKKQHNQEKTTRELQIMRRLAGVTGHPSGGGSGGGGGAPSSSSSLANVVQLVDVFEAPEKLFLISELCEGGELYDLIFERANMKPKVSEIPV